MALVTGGKRGIGRAIALTFAEARADVAVCDYLVDDGELEAVAEEIKRLGRRSLAVQADVSQQSDVDNLFKRVMAEFGVTDILVTNAGISGLGASAETPEEQWHKVIDVNLTGCYLCSQAVVDGMVERKKGNIINIASVEGLRGGAVAGALMPVIQARRPAGLALTGRPYNVSKAGIIMLTRALARQYDAVPGFGASDCRCRSHLFFGVGDMMPTAVSALEAVGLEPRLKYVRGQY